MELSKVEQDFLLEYLSDNTDLVQVYACFRINHIAAEYSTYLSSNGHILLFKTVKCRLRMSEIIKYYFPSKRKGKHNVSNTDELKHFLDKIKSRNNAHY